MADRQAGRLERRVGRPSARLHQSGSTPSPVPNNDAIRDSVAGLGTRRRGVELLQQRASRCVRGFATPAVSARSSPRVWATPDRRNLVRPVPGGLIGMILAQQYPQQYDGGLLVRHRRRKRRRGGSTWATSACCLDAVSSGQVAWGSGASSGHHRHQRPGRAAGARGGAGQSTGLGHHPAARAPSASRHEQSRSGYPAHQRARVRDAGWRRPVPAHA